MSRRPRILVAEDEAPQREALVALLAAAWPAADVVAACADGLEALEAFERERPEVVFLDVRMPGLLGTEVARAIASRAHVVFVTAHDAHAVAAFELGAVDYLLKPVRPDRLAAAVARLEARLGEPPPPLDRLLEHVAEALARGPRPDRLRWITATVGPEVRIYPIDDVLGFRAQDKYTTVLTRADDAHIRTSLRELIERLDPDAFWQVHRSVVVRASAIAAARKDELGKTWIVLRDRPDVLLPVSSAFQSRFRGM